MKARRRAILSLAALLGLWVPAHAGTISFTGDLATDATFLPPFSPPYIDGDYAQYAAAVRLFHVTTSSLMQAITFSYGGGVNGAGSTIADSGFEPYLSLFDAAGNFLASTFFATTCPSGAHTNSSTGFCYDVLLDGGVLAAGDYKIAISAFENLSFAENQGNGTLADGFTGLGNLAPGEDLHYAFDVILTDTSGVPEPSTLFSTTGALLAVALVHFLNRKERSSEGFKEYVDAGVWNRFIPGGSGTFLQQASHGSSTSRARAKRRRTGPQSFPGQRAFQLHGWLHVLQRRLHHRPVRQEAVGHERVGLRRFDRYGAHLQSGIELRYRRLLYWRPGSSR